MGEKLVEYYEYVKEEEGFSGKIELAQETSIPSAKAATEPDSEENIEKIRDAIEDITGESPPRL